MVNRVEDVERARMSPRDRLIAIAGYGAGTFGLNIAIFPVTYLLFYYLTDTLGLGIALATAVITAPKIWDMIADPAVGAISDQYARSRGRRFPVFASIAFALPIFACITFALPHVSNGPFVLLAIAGLVLFSSSFTIFLVNHVAAADDLAAANVAPRNLLLSIRTVGQAGGTMMIGAVAPLVLGAAGSSQAGYRTTALGAAAIGAAFLVVFAFTLRRVPTSQPSSGSSRLPSLISSIKGAMSKPKALSVIFSNFGVTLAASYLTTIIPYVNKLVLKSPDSNLSPIFVSTTLTMLVGAAGISLLARRLGNSRTFLVCSAGLIVASGAFYWASGSYLSLIASQAMWGLAMGGYAVMLPSLVLDATAGEAGDAGLTGLLLGLLFATGKLADTFGGVLVGATLVRAGSGLRLRFGLIPCALVLAGTIAMLLLDRATKARST